jgi:hypothetical protein
MTTAFAHTPNLEILTITSPPSYNTAALTKAKKGIPPPFNIPSDMPPCLVKQLQVFDPSLPEVRDLRKFVKRLPHLRTIKWVGRGGKGEWRFTAPALLPGGKRSTLVGVEMIHAAVLHRGVWERCQEVPPNFSCVASETGSGVESSGGERGGTGRNGSQMALELPLTPFTPAKTDFPMMSRMSTGSTSASGGNATGVSPVSGATADPRTTGTSFPSRQSGAGKTRRASHGGVPPLVGEVRAVLDEGKAWVWT